MTVPADQGFELTVIRGEQAATLHVPASKNCKARYRYFVILM